MSLEEKRKHYKCGRDYLTLRGIPTWSNSHKSKLTEPHCSACVLLETENPHGIFFKAKKIKATCHEFLFHPAIPYPEGTNESQYSVDPDLNKKVFLLTFLKSRH